MCSLSVLEQGAARWKHALTQTALVDGIVPVLAGWLAGWLAQT